MKLRTSSFFGVLLVLVPLCVRAEEPAGGDGDPGVYDVAPPPPTHPVLVALDAAPFCGAVPDWPLLMKDVGVTDLRAAIDDGTVGIVHLQRSISAMVAIGTISDVEALWLAAEDLSWEYVVDVVDALASDEEVLQAQARLAGTIRRDVLANWSERNDVPNAVVEAALQDPDPRVRRNAARIALASGDQVLQSKGLEACEVDPAVASVGYLCSE